MKQTITLLVFLFVTSIGFSQKGEKMKGSKTVTTEERATPNFSSVYIQDNIQVTFIKADSTGIELEADDNLHEALKTTNNGGNLNVSLNNKLRSFKKFEVKIYYTDALRKIEATDEAKLMILDEMQLEDVAFKMNEKSKLFLNLKSKVALIELNDDASAELNAKSEKIHFILNKNAIVKGLVATTEMKVDQYQKSRSTFEGDAIDLKLRMDNNSKFAGKNLTAKNVEILAEGYSETSINVETNCIINGFANSEIELFGEPTIELKKFTGKTILKKNVLK
ncbi:GIN domain-containing protein [Flavobacterium antarcticum]|uniref:GIN domain-containing protein n=1 Tax=Flavobacterium antarcticum TaxID=271155 RepID=UPI0003B36CE7|nr:DUF2807 domain-containing protein [Flavobacterium antarcticum]